MPDGLVCHRLPAYLLLCLLAATYPAWLPAAAAADDQRTALHNIIDNIITTQRFLDDIPAASVAVVSHGKILYLRGHGQGDAAGQSPVRAERTLFGTGSVSKLLIWTAVMQLVEQGRLDLDRDVNHYLGGFQVPATWPEPVTLAHLLTHTAGFEDRSIGFYARRPEDLVPLKTFLASHMPARVYPPGQVSAYSNYGAALAGHIVAEVSGMPFEQYIEDHILIPLGMTRSSFRQPLPASLAADEVRGYRGPGGPAGRSWYQARPSGALRATAADMARFMIGHLQQGRLGATRIISPASAAAMQQRQFSNHPDVNGLTFGFQELERGGQRILWQRGDTLFFTAAVFLLPALDLGVYVAYNRARVGHAPLELLDAILAHRHPVEYRPVPRRPPAEPAPTSGLTGSYRSSRSNETTPEKLLKPFKPVRVRAHAPGVLQISGLAMGGDTLWVEQAPLRYQAIDSAEFVVFREGQDGQPTSLYEGNMPAAGYFRLPWYGVPELHSVLLAACSLVFLATLAGRMWQVGRRLFDMPTVPLHAPAAHRSATALSAVNLVFIAALWVAMGNVLQLLFGIPPLVRVVLLLPPISVALTVLTAVLTLQVWLNRTGSVASRLQLALLTLAGLVFLWMLFYWQLV